MAAVKQFTLSTPTTGPLTDPDLAPRPPGPRGSLGRFLRAFVVLLVSVALVFVGGLVVYVDHPFGGNCLDWWVYCPTGPGATPLGTALSLGNETGGCIPGHGPTPNCGYTFPIRVYAAASPTAAIPSASDLAFLLLNRSDMTLTSSFIIVLTNQTGGWEGIWSSSSSSWSTAGLSGSCQETDCLSAPLNNGESLLLQSLPSRALVYSDQGDQLRVEATSGGFAGFYDAPID